VEFVLNYVASKGAEKGHVDVIRPIKVVISRPNLGHEARHHLY